MDLRAMKIKEYDTKEMKRLIQNTDLKVTIHDTRDLKHSHTDFCTVFWRDGGGPETIGGVFKKKMTKRFAIRICNWLDKVTVNVDDDEEFINWWEEYLKNTVIKEYEPV